MAIAVAGGNTVIAVQTPSNALLFYWNEYGANTWHGEQVAASGTTFSAPTMAPDGDSVIIAAQGVNNSLDFYWQTNGTTAWHLEVIGASPDGAAPSITTMNHGSGDGVCVISQDLVEYCAVNGTANWQSSLPCLPTCQLLSGYDAVITENNGSDNIAIFSFDGGTLFFYWSDSSGTFHTEVVATGVT